MKLINYLCVAILGVWFALMGLFNSVSVPFHYVLGKAEWPLVLVMLLCFVAGALFSLMIFGFRVLFWRGRAHAFERQLDREHREADEAQVQARFEEEVKQQ